MKAISKKGKIFLLNYFIDKKIHANPDNFLNMLKIIEKIEAGKTINAKATAKSIGAYLKIDFSLDKYDIINQLESFINSRLNYIDMAIRLASKGKLNIDKLLAYAQAIK